jgi:predicted transcriptional regulator
MAITTPAADAAATRPDTAPAPAQRGTTNVTIRLPDDLHASLLRAAEEAHRSLSGQIVSALRDWQHSHPVTVTNDDLDAMLHEIDAVIAGEASASPTLARLSEQTRRAP